MVCSRGLQPILLSAVASSSGAFSLSPSSWMATPPTTNTPPLSSTFGSPYPNVKTRLYAMDMNILDTTVDSITSMEHQSDHDDKKKHNKIRPSTSSTQERTTTTTLPTTMSEAIQTFFWSGDKGPSFVVLALVYFSVARLTLVVEQAPTTMNLLLMEPVVFAASIIFWVVQEHVLHQRLLHSNFDWMGKIIHQEHHNKPYFHISVDPAWMLLGWLATAHLLCRQLLPLPLALTATLGYSLAGLFYEWSHYIVHTKVPLKSSFWKTVKQNHMRHHLVNDSYWFGFSLPMIDDLFGTNPPIRQARLERKMANKSTAKE